MSALATIPQEALGFAAGTLTTIAFVPQLVRIIRMRSAHDISWWTFAIFSVGIVLWLWYGFRVDARPLILANLVTLALAMAILALKWLYGRRDRRTGAAPERNAERQFKE